jgi:hypothetical protein
MAGGFSRATGPTAGVAVPRSGACPNSTTACWPCATDPVLAPNRSSLRWTPRTPGAVLQPVLAADSALCPNGSPALAAAAGDLEVEQHAIKLMSANA